MSELFQLSGILKIVYPIELGKIEDYTAWEKLMHGIFYSKLRIDPSNAFILFLKEPYWSRTQIFKIEEILFETFNAAGIGFIETTQMLPYCGVNKCIFGSIGAEVSMFTAVDDGRPFNWELYDIGGNDVLRYFQHLLKKRHPELNVKMSDLPNYEAFQRDFFYLSMDIQKDLKQSERCVFFKRKIPLWNDSYEVDVERFQAPEVLFDHKIIKKELDVNSITEMIKTQYESIEEGDPDDFIKKIVLCGGTAAIPNLELRLRRELPKLIKNIDMNNIEIMIPPQPDSFLVKTANKNLDQLLQAKNNRMLFMTKLQYEDHGPEGIGI
mgnify:CR=1 FL=1